MALKDAYLNLVTSQHRNKPKFMATVEKLLDPLDGVFAAATFFDDAFDLDDAQGCQQDLLGEILGQPRALDFRYEKNTSSILDDEAYRVIQKAKIIRNLWNGELGDLYEKWLTLFGAPIRVRDNQDMTMSVLLDIDESSELQKLMKLTAHGLIVPKPMGVKIKFDFHYPDIHMSVVMINRIESVQFVDAYHILWNLGAARSVRRDGAYDRSGLIRYSGIHPDEQYRALQTHQATCQAFANARQPYAPAASSATMQSVETSLVFEHRLAGYATQQESARQQAAPQNRVGATGTVLGRQDHSHRIVNLRDGSFCRDGSHTRTDNSTADSLLKNLCTIKTIRNGMEAFETV